MEQRPFSSELDLPACSKSQASALSAIREAGGSYHLIGNLGWLPPNGASLSPAARDHFRRTHRTILGLIRSGYLTITREIDGQPVEVALSFP